VLHLKCRNYGIALKPEDIDQFDRPVGGIIKNVLAQRPRIGFSRNHTRMSARVCGPGGAGAVVGAELAKAR